MSQTMTINQPLHFLKLEHQTSKTNKDYRRSPVRGPSYDANLELEDETTGKTIYRKHTDDTSVIYNEVFSNDKKTMYGDKSIPVKDRIQKLWNDMYKSNANDNERVRASGQIGLPYFLTQEQAIELTKKLGEFFCTRFNRPCQLSIHWKSERKPDKELNHHIHISLTERELVNGKFQNKRKKFYKDLDGNLIYDKKYKNENGWDIRKPIIDSELVKAEEDRRKKAGIKEEVDPYQRNTETGDYIFQKLDKQNRKQWDSDTHQGKWLEKNDLSQLHDEVDKIVNDYLKELGYEVTVKRTDKRIIKLIKENNLKNLRQIRVPERDYKTNSDYKKEIDAENSRRKYIQEKLEQNFASEDFYREEIKIATLFADHYKNLIELRKKDLERDKIAYAAALEEEKILFQQNENSSKRKTEENPKKEKSLSFGSEQQNEKLENSRPYTAITNLYNATLENKIEYSDDFYNNYFKNKRDFVFDEMVKDVLEKTKTEKPYLTYKYLKSHRIILKEIAEQYAPQSYEEWKRWSKISVNYYEIGHPKNKNVPGKQKSKNQDYEQGMEQGMERTL